MHPESIRFKDKRFLTQQVAAIADSDFGNGGGTARQAGEFGFGVEQSLGKGGFAVAYRARLGGDVPDGQDV